MGKIIVKHGLDHATMVAVSRFINATQATRLGTAYEIDHGEIPQRIVTAVTRIEGLQSQARPRSQDESCLPDDVVYMFKFFQKQSERLDVSDEEKERFKTILMRVKRIRALMTST
nr:hypothetical protein [Candidatus Sigynarchaeota archaeon]